MSKSTFESRRCTTHVKLVMSHKTITSIWSLVILIRFNTSHMLILCHDTLLSFASSQRLTQTFPTFSRYGSLCRPWEYGRQRSRRLWCGITMARWGGDNNMADIVYIFLLRGRRANQKPEERLFPLQSIKWSLELGPVTGRGSRTLSRGVRALDQERRSVDIISRWREIEGVFSVSSGVIWPDPARRNTE